MKESIASALIILSLCALGFYTSNMATDFCEDLRNSIKECIEAIYSEEWKAAEAILEKEHDKFEKTSAILKTFCVHKDINDIGNAISSLHSAIISQNKDESFLQASALVSYIDILSETDLLNFENIL